MTFTGVLQTIGHDFSKGLKFALQYAVPIEKLVGLLFPSTAPVTNELADATALIQTAVLLVEQKFAASGMASGTGQQKLAEVLLLTGDTVSKLLVQAGLPVNPAYVAKLVSAVVAILNVQQMPADTPAATK